MNRKLTWVDGVPRGKFVEHDHGSRWLDRSSFSPFILIGSKLTVAVAVQNVSDMPCWKHDLLLIGFVCREHPCRNVVGPDILPFHLNEVTYVDGSGEYLLPKL